MILIITSLVAILLLIWFRTEAYIEYCRQFDLNNISLYKEYDAWKSLDERLTYLKFLKTHHDSFFIRLISCPICLSFWLSIILSLITLNVLSFPIVMIGGLLLYLIADKLLG